jgi:hypothetical protein
LSSIERRAEACRQAKKRRKSTGPLLPAKERITKNIQSGLRDRKPLVLPDGGQSVFSLAYQEDIVRAVAANLGNAATFGCLLRPQLDIFRDYLLPQQENSLRFSAPSCVSATF